MLSITAVRDARLDQLDEADRAWGGAGQLAEELESQLTHQVLGGITHGAWTGPAATAAKARLETQLDQLKVAAAELRNVALALRSAQEAFQGARRELFASLDYAHAHKLTVHDDGCATVPGITPGSPGSAAYQAQFNAADSATRMIQKALAQATEADLATARALDRFARAVHGFGADDGVTAVALAGDTGIALALSGGPDANQIPERGTDPAQIRAWWNRLDPTAREAYLTAYPQRMGWLDGLPVEARHQANRATLDAHLSALRRRELFLTGRERQILEGLEQIDRKIRETSLVPGAAPLYLLGIDTAKDGKALVAVGNPDTARHTAVFVPGYTNAIDDIHEMVGKCQNIQVAADQLTKGQANDVSVVAWMGYDAPEGLNAPALVGEWRTRAGADDLTPFMRGLHTSNGGDPHLTLIGHSYGSTVVGEAAQRPGGSGADDVIVAGSPGAAGAEHASQLHTDPGHVWAGAAGNDPVSNYGSGLSHGPNPAAPEFGANRFHVDTSGHSNYWTRGSESLINQANIIMGRYHKVELDHGRRPDE